MAISYTDALGPVIDTGVAVQPTPRLNTDIELHTGREVDVGSSIAITPTNSSRHRPRREQGSPR